MLRIAPNGDISVAETSSGRIRVLRPGDDGSKIAANEVFASGLSRPFGIAFFPRDNPQWVYVANGENVIRFAYRAERSQGDGKTRGSGCRTSPGAAWLTRVIVFTPDRSAGCWSPVGSASNVGEGMGNPPGGLEASGEGTAARCGLGL